MSDNQRRPFRQPDPPLADEAVRLRRLAARGCRRDATGLPGPRDRALDPADAAALLDGDATEYIAHTARGVDSGLEASFAIVDPETDGVLGSISLHRDSLEAMVGRVLGGTLGASSRRRDARTAPRLALGHP